MLQLLLKCASVLKYNQLVRARRYTTTRGWQNISQLMSLFWQQLTTRVFHTLPGPPPTHYRRLNLAHTLRRATGMIHDQQIGI